MKIEKNRHLMILDGLMKASAPITAEQLAFLADSSVRTVKEDIPYLNRMLEKENIARICSYKAKGYQLEVIDPESYAKFAENILILQRMYYRRPIETINRRLYIIHSFLAQDLVSIEELGDKDLKIVPASKHFRAVEYVPTVQIVAYEMAVLNGVDVLPMSIRIPHASTKYFQTHNG